MQAPELSHCANRDLCILKHVEEKKLLQLGPRFAKLTYNRGATIVGQREPVAGCYIICQGKAKLYRRTREGKKQLLKLLNTGDILADELLAGEDWYNASLSTLDEVETLFIGREEFFALLERYPAVAREVRQRLAREALQLQQKLTRISYESGEKVLASLILELGTSYGTPARKGRKVIDLVLTVEELAEMAGTTRETMTRCLKDLKEKGFITRSGHKLVILDDKGLRDFINKSRG